MNIRIPLIALLLTAVPAAESPGADAVPVKLPVTLADFTKGAMPDIELNRGRERGQKLEPDAGSSTLRIEWTRSKNGYWEWSFRKPPALPEYTAATIRTTLTAESGVPVDRLSLRFIDATGEVLQYTRPVGWNGETVRELNWNLTPGTPPDVSWGGNNDRKPDFPLRFLGVSGDFRPGDGTGAVRLSAVEAEFDTRMKRSETVVFELDGTGPVNIVRPDSPVRLLLRNRTLSPVTVNAAADHTDFDGMRITRLNARPPTNDDGAPPRQIPFTLSPGERREFTTLSTDQLRPGIHWLEFRITNPDDRADETIGTDSFAVMEPAGPTPGRSSGFLFGICSHPNWTANREIHRKEAEAMALVGAKVLRVDFEWQQIERQKGQIDNTLNDGLVETFADRGIEFEAILGKPPQWAVINGNLPDYGEWRRFVRNAFSRYRGKIRYWEVWNEPDLTGFATFTAPEYAELMRIVREERDAVAPEAVLLTGGFATMTPHGSKKEGFQEEALRLGKGLFDIHAYHEHGGFTQFVRMVDDRFLPMRRSLGITEPWYANETAISSAAVSEREQAVTLARKLVFSWSRGAIGYNWYNLRNKGDNPKDGEHNYGMITSDFRPKAVYVAYNTLVRMLREHAFVREHPVPGGMLFEFRSNGQRLLCGWRTDARAGTGLKVAVRSGAEAETVDLMGSAAPAERLGDVVLLTLGDAPVFLRLSGSGPVELPPPPVVVPMPPLAAAGGKFELPVELAAPGGQPAAFELKLTTGTPDLGIEPAETILRLSAGERRTWRPVVTVAPGFKSDHAGLRLTYRIPAAGFTDTLEIPLHFARRIPAVPDARPADFLLNRRSQVTSLFDADPTRARLLWSGPEDLSAEFRLGADAENLLIRVEVTDDRHVQPFRGHEAWQGDNIQLALEFPNPDGLWEFGLTRLDSGEPECGAWSVPPGFDAAKCSKAVRLRTGRDGTRTTYEAVIPLATLGVTRDALRNGFRINLLVNDNDGEGREGWIALAPGIGEKKDAADYPFVMIP